MINAPLRRLRRQARQLVKMETAASVARGDVAILEQASADAFAAQGAIAAGRSPTLEPANLLANAARRSSRDVRPRLALPAGTSAELRAQRVLDALDRAADCARRRADRLARDARIAADDFAVDALAAMQANAVAAHAFAAALTLNDITAAHEPAATTIVRFRNWITGRGIGTEIKEHRS